MRPEMCTEHSLERSVSQRTRVQTETVVDYQYCNLRGPENDDN